MDIILIILGFVLILSGLAGAILPIPGPPLSFLGILFIHWTSRVEFANSSLMWFGVLTLILVVLDYLLPVWGIKKFGGSKWGMWGSTIGLLIGMTGGLIGILVGAFLGGFIGEFLIGKSNKAAFKAATGSFVGFLFGVILKAILSGIMLWYAVRYVWISFT